MKKIITLLMLCLAMATAAYAQDEPDATGLKVGDVAPDFSLYNQHEQTFKLSKALASGPVVLFFYRGQWCPYCTQYMKNYQDSLSFIKAKGAQVAGISAQNESGVQKSIEKTGATFHLLTDANKKVCFKYQVVNKSGMLNEEANPVPALYVIGKDGKIKYVHFPDSYMQRASVSEVLKHLD